MPHFFPLTLPSTINGPAKLGASSRGEEGGGQEKDSNITTQWTLLPQLNTSLARNIIPVFCWIRDQTRIISPARKVPYINGQTKSGEERQKQVTGAARLSPPRNLMGRTGQERAAKARQDRTTRSPIVPLEPTYRPPEKQ